MSKNALRRIRTVFASSLVLLFLTAARPARVITGTAEVYADPSAESTVLETLQFDAALAVSNVATEGFFKVRTADGKVGWISSTVLKLEGEAPEMTEGEGRSTPSTPQGDSRVPGVSSKVMANLVGGAYFGVPPDVNLLFGLSGVRTHLQAGAEFEWRFSKHFGLLFRGEWQGLNSVITDSETGANFTLVSTAIPLELGVNTAIISTRQFELGLGVLGGVSPVTWVSTEDLPNSTGENATFASAVGFSGLVRLNAAFRIVSRFSILIEGGWRMILTGQTVPAVEGSGVDLWKNPDTGDLIPLALSQSGPFVSGGLRIAF